MPENTAGHPEEVIDIHLPATGEGARIRRLNLDEWAAKGFVEGVYVAPVETPKEPPAPVEIPPAPGT